MDLKAVIRTIPNFPKQGIMFRDITTLLKNKDAFSYVIDQLVVRYTPVSVNAIVGIESRGFIIGAALAHRLGVGFVPVRKPGKLPAATDAVEYLLEYGKDKLEIHEDALLPGQRVIIVDDLLATGGTMKAAIQLVERRGAKVHECAVVIDLPDLPWKETLKGYSVYTLVSFEGH